MKIDGTFIWCKWGARQIGTRRSAIYANVADLQRFVYLWF